MRTLLLILALLAPAADRPADARERTPGVERKLEIIEKNLAALGVKQGEVRAQLAAVGKRLAELGRELTTVGSDARRTAVVLEVGRLQGDARALEERLRGLGRAMGPFRAEAERLRALL